MDPFSVGGIVFASGSAIIATASTVRKVRSAYRDAEKQQLHVRHVNDNVLVNHSLLQDCPSKARAHLPQLDLSLSRISNALSAEPPITRKREKFNWAVRGKGKAEAQLADLKSVESSASLTLLLGIVKELEELRHENSVKTAFMEHIMEQFANHEQQSIYYDSQLHLIKAYYHKESSQLTPSRTRKRSMQELAARKYCWDWLLRLGITMQLIVSAEDYHNAYSIFISWPLFYSVVFIWRMTIMNGRPNLPYVSLRPHIVIPDDAAIIQACKQRDLLRIKNLLSELRAHVNSVTRENLTLLRFAIRSGSSELVKLLLDNGADPNQTFGQNETSPLDNAFIIGDLDIIRLLLSAKADLDYINSRPWTAVYYLWDPTPRNYATTASILNLCVNEGYSSWYITDYAGWTPLHRAAAYGNDNDLRKLFNLGVYDRKAIPRAQFNWLPIHCAARYGNVSTFLYLANETLLPPANELLDTRGWSFLHLAAASGSHEMIALLFELGFDPLTLTDYDSFTLPDELLNKELTAQTIAEHYGHADVYIKALKERQLIIHKDIDLEKIEKALVDLG